MSTPTRLSAPRIAVVLAEPGQPEVEVVVQTDNRDLVRWDVTRARKGWPEFKDSPFLWQTFLAWSVMHREKQTTLKLDDFLECCLQANSLKAEDADDDEDTETVGPTQPDRVSG